MGEWVDPTDFTFYLNLLLQPIIVVMMSSNKKCIVEGCMCNADKGRRYCHRHFLDRVAARRKARKEAGLKVRTLYEKECLVCGKSFLALRKDGKYCSDCWKKIMSYPMTKKDEYVYNKGDYKVALMKHRAIAIRVLGRKLSTNEVIHHLDGNKQNNELTNLIVMTRRKHVQLHAYLNIQGALIRERIKENVEDCWNSLIVPMTTAWLETTSAKVIKLWEIGQSAAEPLLNEESSETMHDTSRTDDDIVQTTT